METAVKRKRRSSDNGLITCFAVLLFLLLLNPVYSFSQILYSSISGTVTDRQTQSPLPGATVILLNAGPLQGTTTDTNGRFRLDNVPIGKQQLKITYVGYSTFITGMITVNSGREAEIQVSLEESAITGKEVEITGEYRKYEAINRMAAIGVRSFSVDETSRFAGSYNDPARMAQNFAGVTSGIDNRNDIIVRGNSPLGIQWRIDDMEIPNPNHFAAVGTTGGPVTILNNNLLTNSDFFTGTFPARYINALSGVFDLRMKNGNSEKREYWVGIGWNGLEIGSEGPLNKKSRSSYLFSYRYSLLDILSKAGIKLNVVPGYQDLNFKVTLPTKHSGQFSITGIGGTSFIKLSESNKSSKDWMFPDYGEDLSNGSDLGVIGITHQVFPNSSLQLKNLIYLTGSRVETKVDSFSNVFPAPSRWAGEKSSEVRISYSSQITKKFSSEDLTEYGLNLDHFMMNFADSMMWKGNFMKNTGSKERMSLLRAYGQWKHSFTEKFSLTAGVSGSYLTLNKTWSAEPRFGLTWELTKKHRINFGAGLYSEIQPHVIYFITTRLADGETHQSNLGLDYTRNAQSAIGYDFIPGKLHFRAEIYYQYLYDIPVKQSIPEYSLMNQGHEFFLDRQYSDSLVNKGTAVNYGTEFTLEHYFMKNFFYLITCSLFDSRYTGYDKVLRNSAFNVNTVINAATGYEFITGRRKWGVISFGLRGTWTRGNPYIPFNVNQTIATKEAIPDWKNAYTVRYPDYQRYTFRFGIKRNLPGYNLEFLLDLQYRTNYTNVYLQRIDPSDGEIRKYFRMGFFPMGTWRIQF